ncbi:MAG: hypothetical protein AB1772_06955 [Candidatus Zixiibacteriota bacterium]
MHPSRDDLILYIDGTLADLVRRQEISDHVEACEFCAEFCRNYRQLAEPTEPTAAESLPEKFSRLRDSLYESALRSLVVDLKPLISERPEVSYLAADGPSGKQPAVRKIATLYSESPEVVVQIMRNTEQGRDYLQIQSEEPRLAAHIMVQLPELGREFVTDAHGRAELDLSPATNLEQLKWQIKMPDAVFALEPLAYDPDKVEYTREMTLQTDRHDRIDIRFEGRTEGKQLSIRVVELDGRTDFGPVKVVVTQKSRTNLVSALAGTPVMIGPVDPDTTIDIRLYQ